MKYLASIAILALAAPAFAAGCDGHDHAHQHTEDAHEHAEHAEDEHAEDAEDAHEHAEDAIEVSPAMAEAIGLTVATAAVSRLEAECVFYAYGETDPDARRTIAAQVPGIIEFAAPSLADVQPGAELLAIVSPELIDLSRAIAALEARDGVYRQLGTSNANLATELDRLRSQFQTLAGTNTVAGGQIVQRATAAGRFRRLVPSGAKVERGEAVGELTAAGRLRFATRLASAAVRQLGDGDLAVDDAGNAFTVRREDAPVRGMVDIVLVAPDGLTLSRDLVGSRRRFRRRVPAGDDGAIVVPDSAIVRSGWRYWVFVRDPHDADRFLRREVVPGSTAQGLTAVAGIAAGETVAAAGARELDLALAAGAAAPAGHFHADGQFHAGDD